MVREKHPYRLLSICLRKGEKWNEESGHSDRCYKCMAYQLR
ncbi:hypothetical protein QY96_03336 [Bacillus thermotolerans]|nr:hypothetical protein QY96_03336 [Bacillus thermotolerans]